MFLWAVGKFFFVKKKMDFLLIFFVGRDPNVEIGLDKAGVKLN